MAGGIAALQLVREAGLGDLVRPASEHAPEELGSQRALPVRPELRPLFPGGTLRRGSVIAIAAGGPSPDGPAERVGARPESRAGRSAVGPGGRGAGGLFAGQSGVRTGGLFAGQPAAASAGHPAATSLLLAVMAEASKAGSWCAVVGVPTLGAGAALELGIALDRLALVPNPGPDWPTVVGALLDGFDIVVVGAPVTIAPVIASRLAARARQRGAVLMPYGPWPAVDLTLDAVDPAWHGLDSGRGRLRGRQLTVTARGRGAASAPRLTHLWLPQPSGVLPAPGGELRPPLGQLPPPGGELRPTGQLRLVGEASEGSLATVHRLPPGGPDALGELGEEVG